MGAIMSPEEDVEKIRIIDATATPRRVQSVVAVGDQIVIKVDDNTVITGRKRRAEKWAFPPSVDGWGFGWIPDALKALKKLNMISQVTIDAHTAFCAKRDTEITRRADLKTIERMSKRHGLTVPKSWQKKLKT